ncbi:MAG: hypothetical protein H0W88_03185 [Parachlamydiaceae bacterium]|nr:hypothetical protein [Parachlamydiaceae bacterium]
MFLWVITLFSLIGCQHGIPKKPIEPPKETFNWQKINSRDEEFPSSRFPLYLAKVPSDWTRVDPSSTESIADTTKPLCEFYINEDTGSVRITVHYFPSENIKDRIPPSAQIQRWKSQFESIDPALTITETESHSGFVGLYLECQGVMQGKPTKLMGWAMQLAPEYYRRLSHDDSFFTLQKRADYTIKAVGSPEIIDKHHKEIMTFGQSFELIEVLPSTP